MIVPSLELVLSQYQSAAQDNVITLNINEILLHVQV